MKLYFDKIKTWAKQKWCNHERWDSDNQIRLIKCKKCGKNAWVDSYRNLYE
jgi:hypothetical protein